MRNSGLSSSGYNQLPGSESLASLDHRVVTARISWVAGVCGPELPGPSCPQIMPCLEAVALILLIVLVPDPPRGAAEKQGVVTVGGPRSTWCEDVRYLGRK